MVVLERWFTLVHKKNFDSVVHGRKVFKGLTRYDRLNFLVTPLDLEAILSTLRNSSFNYHVRATRVARIDEFLQKLGAQADTPNWAILTPCPTDVSLRYILEKDESITVPRNRAAGINNFANFDGF